MNECLATYATLGFWRELLKPNFSAIAIQKKGAEIGKTLIQIQNATNELLSIYPDDIKFHFRYGMFLIKVINNDSDGTDEFKKAANTLFTKVLKNQDSKIGGSEV